jgi:hypothetical protein
LVTAPALSEDELKPMLIAGKGYVQLPLDKEQLIHMIVAHIIPGYPFEGPDQTASTDSMPNL